MRLIGFNLLFIEYRIVNQPYNVYLPKAYAYG